MKYKTHLTKHFLRERKFNPQKCRKATFRTKAVSPETEIVLCKKKGSKKQSVQAVLHRR